MIPSMRTKRRRVNAEIAKCLMQLTDNNLSDTCQSDLSGPTEICSNELSVSVDHSGAVLVIDNEHNTAGSLPDGMFTCDLGVCTATDLSDAAVVMSPESSNSKSVNDPFECFSECGGFAPLFVARLAANSNDCCTAVTT